MAAFTYRCSTCRRRYRRDELRYLCPVCAPSCRPGKPLAGVLTVEFDYEVVRKKFRPTKPDWRLLTAVEPEFFPPYPMVETPYYRSAALGDAFGLADVWIKNDAQLPSGSLKDRASFLVVAEANRLGEGTIVTASTGNAASALAAVCASAGKRAVIFVPRTAPPAKLAQMLVCGAQVVPVDGTYDDAFRLSLEYTARFGGLNRNTAYHPLTLEGKKTAGLEIWRQNGGRAPAAIVVPTGDGVILAGVHKAFHDLRAAGVIPQLPRMVCVQAESSAAIHRYLTTGRFRRAAQPATIADSISVGVPANAHLAREAVERSGGFSLTVTDREILAAQRTLAETTGIFAEPAAAAAVAALGRIRKSGRLAPRDQIVVLVTGHGLKDVGAALQGVRIPPAIPPTTAGLEAAATRLEEEEGP